MTDGKPTTGHPAAGKLQEIADDLAQDARAWREWEFWSAAGGMWRPPGNIRRLISSALEDPDKVRRRSRPHRAEWQRYTKCGNCGMGPLMEMEPLMEAKEGGGEYTCAYCGHTAPIKETNQ